ncbi:MAG: ATP-binding protein [Formosimonas sp.]
MNKKYPSIQRTLLGWSFAILLLVGSGSVYWLSNHLREEMNEFIDANLIQYTNSLYMLEQQIQGYNHVSSPLDFDKDSDDEHEHERTASPMPVKKPTFNNTALSQYANQYSHQFQIWDLNQQQLIIRSNNAPETPIADFNHVGFSNQADSRVYAYLDADKQRMIFVAQERNLAKHLIDEMLWQLLTPILLSFVLLLVLFYCIIQRGLRPLSLLNQAIAQRSPLNLNPIAIAKPPIEITPVVDSVNQLMGQLEDSLNKERHFTGNAAHELRTPLAVIDTLTQAALKSQDLSILPKIKAATGHAQRQIEQLLTLARLDAHASLEGVTSVNVYQTCQAVCADLLHSNVTLSNKNVDVQLHGEPNTFVHSTPELLYILLKNLIDNALTHTPDAGCVRIEIHNTPHPSIQICDTGAGIADEQLQRITERFYRAEQKHQGFGIGLSIVQRICQLHLAQLSILNRSDGQTGLCVAVVFK